MSNFLGPLSMGDDGALSQDGSLAENQNASTTMKADYRVSTGTENEPDDQSGRQNALASGSEGDTGQNPISQTPGWDGNVTTNYVDSNYKNTPLVGDDFSSGPDQQGQMLRGYVLNGPDVTVQVEQEGVAAQKGSMYQPRVNVLHDPNGSKGR